MPPRFAYWTIIAGGLPTAFRATDREELLPTFARLKEKQPDAEMKWFARGKLWASPEEASAQRERRFGGGDRDNRPRDRERQDSGDAGRERRGRDWRPGGEHRDPRQRFKDAKKDRNQRIKAEKFVRKTGRPTAPATRPHGDSPAPERRPRPDGPRAFAHKPARHDAPRERPHGDPLARERRPRPDGPRSAGGGASRKEWTPKPRGRDDGTWQARPPAGDRGARKPDRRESDWRKRDPKPQSRGESSSGRRDWTAKPPREKPHGDKLTRPPRPTGPSGDRGGYRGTPNDSRWNQKPRPEGRGTYRGEGHGTNSWKPKPPRDERAPNSGERRPFAPRGFERDRARGGGAQDPQPPPKPRGPNREPRPSEQPEPSPPPRPSEPVIPPPGPPERGRLNRNKRHR